MKRNGFIFYACVVMFFVFTNLYAQSKSIPSSSSNNVGITGRIGTLGLGAELSYAFNPMFNARIGINKYTYDYNGKISDVEYDFEYELDSLEFLLDFFPFSGGFHCTVGVLSNNNAVAIDADFTPHESVSIGDTSYSGEDLGHLAGRIDFNSSAPYLGIGWGNAAGEGWIHLNFDIGVLFQGEPSVELNSYGGVLSDDPIVRNELDKEESDIEDDISGYTYYPVLSLGLSFTF